MINKQPNTIIFDLDGTLADSFKIFVDIINPLLPWVGYRKVKNNELESLRNMSLTQIRKLFDLNPIELVIVGLVYRYKLSRELAKAKAFDGTEQTLHELSQRGYRLMILSSNSQKAVENFIENHNFPKFTTIRGGAGVFSKVSALERMLREQNLAKQEVVYVGDEIKDVVSCKRFGIPIIAVSWGFNTKELLSKQHPDYLIDQPRELLDYLG